MALNLSGADKTFRRYVATEGVTHPDIAPSFSHDSPSGDAIAPNATPEFTADAGTDLLSTAGHGLTADTPVRFSSTGTLSGGLSAGTTFYVSASGLTADAFKVSATLGGSAVDITDAGTGTHTWQRYLTTSEQDMVDRWRWNRVDPSQRATTPFSVDASTDLITSLYHGLVAGDAFRFSSTGTLPAGLAAATTYYVIASGLTLGAFKVSATLGGSAVDITDAGTGAHAWGYYPTAAVLATIAAWQAYEASPRHQAWLMDDKLQRHWQWIYRSADHADGAQAAVPPSADVSGSGSGAPASPANVSPN